MRPSILPALAISGLLALSFGGCTCGGSSEPSGGPDSGPNVDGGPDAGPHVDGGPDSGYNPDGGPDAGYNSDGGPDSGYNPDGGCINSGFGCTTTAGSTPCCGGALCETTGGGTSGTCASSSCSAAGQGCSVPGDCCGGRSCIDNVCSDSTCTGTGAACGSGSECCTTLCGDGGTAGDTCQPIPGQEQVCKVLGEPCNPDAGPGGGCCSAVCQGGTCSPQFSCRAYYDICTDDSQCCSLQCLRTQADGGVVGTCANPTGATSCVGSGNPCDPNGSKCCTLDCTDLGTGTTICEPTQGCRVQGDVCSEVEDCCGVSANSACASNRCTNGTACRPAGDLCGKPTIIFSDGGVDCAPVPGNPDAGCFTTTSETNCCNGNKINGHETVCRVDTGGIPRCFGGQSTTCPYGYTGVTPCCIPAGEYCDFRDECCGGAVCATGADGGRQCLPSTCETSGNACASAADCCTGLACLGSSTGSGLVCQTPPPPDAGLPDAGCGDSCCSPNGTACTSPVECCSGTCDATGHCATPPNCQSTGGACAGSSDCCIGLVCNLPAGSTNGTCEPPDAGGTCGATGQTCTVGGTACCTGLTCVSLVTGYFCDGSTACACQ